MSSWKSPQTRWARESQPHPPRQRAKGREKKKRAKRGEPEGDAWAVLTFLGCYSENPKELPLHFGNLLNEFEAVIEILITWVCLQSQNGRRQCNFILLGSTAWWTHMSLYGHTCHFTDTRITSHKDQYGSGMLPGQRLPCAHKTHLPLLLDIQLDSLPQAP